LHESVLCEEGVHGLSRSGAAQRLADLSDAVLGDIVSWGVSEGAACLPGPIYFDNV